MKTLFYFPIDSKPTKKALSALKSFDEIVTYTEYGKSVVEELTPSYISKKLRVIPHAADTDMFFPLPEEKVKEIRAEKFPDAEFVIGMINRNSARKDIATAVLAYNSFRKKPGVEKTVLYLHMNPIDSVGVNLLALCESLELQVGKDVIFPHEFNENLGVDYSQLNGLYNSFDLFLTTTTAEGWGLTVTEAMAAGTLVMAPLHTSLIEITGNGKSAIPLRQLDEIVFAQDMQKIRYKVNTDNLTFMLENTYNTWKHKREEFDTQKAEYLQSANKFISTIPWSKVAGQFKIVFDKLLK